MSSVTKTQFTHTQENIMLKQLGGYLYSLLEKFSEPQSYGSALERYIVSHNPTSTAQVEQLERQFELLYSARNKSWMV